MDSAKAVLDLIAFFTEMVKRIAEAVKKYGTEYDARSLEAYVEEQCKALGAVILETYWRMRMQERGKESSLECECGNRQHYREKRPRMIRGVLGEMNLEERHYYCCDKCGKSTYTGDELRGASDFTQLAEERMAVLGKEGAFGKAAAHLKRLGILSVAGSTVRKVCMRLGFKACQQTDHQAAEQYGAKGERAEERPERLAISVDGTMIGRIDTQHRRRKSKNKGEVPGKGKLKHFFHEVKTLAVFTFNETGEALRKTYYATQERVETFREKVALEAKKRGVDAAKVLVFLGDGAPWVWKTANELFSKAIQILDWYHAEEHLWDVAHAYFGNQEKKLWAWVEKCKTDLWEGRVESVIEAIRILSQEMGEPNPKLSDPQKATDPTWIVYRNVGYFEDNKNRVNYPAYRAQGLPIGSGVMEGGCRHVVGDRLKLTGMRWDEPGAENILALRCHDLNDRWNSLWSVNVAG